MVLRQFIFYLLILTCCATTSIASYSLSGRITYGAFSPISASFTSRAIGRANLLYRHPEIRPLRRALIEAVDNSGQVVSSSFTAGNNGYYLLEQIPDGVSVRIRVVATSVQSAGSSSNHSITTDRCSQARWNISIQDNTQQNAIWSFQHSQVFQNNESQILIHIPTTYENQAYSVRSSAPFAILDTIVSSLHLICDQEPTVSLPPLTVNWSPNNAPVPGDLTLGQIQTSHYRDAEPSRRTPHQLYFLGKENIDTDEFDAHVITHEFSHFLETTLFRRDGIGGNHGENEMLLDPRVSWSEGLATALAVITLNNSTYIDTMGLGQQRGSSVNYDLPPQGNSRGLYDEHSTVHFLWKLFESTSGFQRIYHVLRTLIPASPAFATLHSFASLYNESYARSPAPYQQTNFIESLWSEALGLPYHALCSRQCRGNGDVADLFDSDNDIGFHLEQIGGCPRYYPLGLGIASARLTFDASFWRLYEPLPINTPVRNSHNRIIAPAHFNVRSLGSHRWYSLRGTGEAVTIRLEDVDSSLCDAAGLTLSIYRNGRLIAGPPENQTRWLTRSPGCPRLTYLTQRNITDVVVVRGLNQSVPSWTMLAQNERSLNTRQLIRPAGSPAPRTNVRVGSTPARKPSHDLFKINAQLTSNGSQYLLNSRIENPSCHSLDIKVAATDGLIIDDASIELIQNECVDGIQHLTHRFQFQKKQSQDKAGLLSLQVSSQNSAFGTATSQKIFSLGSLQNHFKNLQKLGDITVDHNGRRLEVMTN